jgi:glycosyltransferase involved in cell wall biosynthesis
MKITIVLGAFFPVPPTMGGGVEKVWFSLAPEFVKRGHDVVMVSRKLPELRREETINGVKHLRVDGFDTPRSLVWLKFLDLIYSLRTMSILRSRRMSELPKADVIVTNTFWLPFLLRNSKRGRVYVHVARYPKGQTRFYGNAARLQAPSQAVARAIADEAPTLAGKISVIPYPAPGSTIAGAPSATGEREKIILFVGRVHPEKGVHLLVEAFADGARTVFADWKLMIVGPTDEKHSGGGESYLVDLKRLAANAGDKIIFRGPIFDQIELEQTLRAARIFVYPSLAERGESFGLAPLEAMAQGCAVFVSDLACFHDFIRDGETGFIFDHRSSNPAESLRARIENVIVDPTLLSTVADAGYRKSAEYSLASVADQFLEDFNSIIANSDAARTSR